ncbi:ribosomal protein S7 domain-containing protein [Xylaria nigripes]|nr:ribosomal protein S7 domain-containing protein [Xylaria nigripes]
MASKIVNPWGSFRSLAIRTRPSAAHHVRITRAMPMARRGMTGDNNMYPPNSYPPNMQSPNMHPSDMYPPEYYQGDHYPQEYQSEPAQATVDLPDPFQAFTDNVVAIQALEEAATGQDVLKQVPEGLKYHMPTPPGKHDQLQDRHHPVIHQVTRMLMRDGKLSKAQRHVGLILNHLRTSSPPSISPLRPLLPGSPPAHLLPLNPLLYLTLAIDSVGPIVRVRSLKGMAGGGAALEVPEPINARARRRQAIEWILDIVNKKQSNGSGRKQFAARFGQEIVAVIEGRSAAWDRRQAVHKLCTAARANLAHPSLVGKKKR